MKAEIAVIGGTGFYDPKLLRNPKDVKLRTPYGLPSDAITVGELEGKRVGVSAETWEEAHDKTD